MNLSLNRFFAFALLGASGSHAYESTTGGLRSSASADAFSELAREGDQCPASQCKGRECITNNTIEVKCTGKGMSSSSIGPTDISSKEEFKNANVCKDACAPGLSCSAKWHGKWSCYGRGELTTFEVMNDEKDDIVDFEEEETNSGSAVAEAEAQQCRNCRGRKCTTNNTVEIKCTEKDGSESSSISSTTISSKKEFNDANVCKGACVGAARCHARWHGQWQCGAVEGELVFIDEDITPVVSMI